MNIKQSIFNYLSSRRPPRKPVFPHFDRVRSVFLIYESDAEERNPDIRSMVAQLHNMNKQVMTWGYVHKDKPLSPNLPDSRMLAAGDFSFLCRPKSEVAQLLASQHFDMLIDLTTTPLLPLQYIAMMAQADFKISAHNLSLYDMVIPVPPTASADYLFQQVLHYVKLIKSAD